LTKRDLPQQLPGDSVFLVMPPYEDVAFEIERRYPGVEYDAISSDGVRQVLVYKCTTANACRGTSG